MRRVDLDAHRVTTGAGMDGRGDRAQRFAEHHVGAAVQQADDLGVALDGHPRHRVLGGQLEELDAHLLHQSSTLGAEQTLAEFRVQVVGDGRHRDPSGRDESAVGGRG